MLTKRTLNTFFVHVMESASISRLVSNVPSPCIGAAAGPVDDTVPEALSRHEPMIRNDLLLLFGGQRYESLESREGRLNLQSLALNALTQVLESENEPSAVEAVYFTSFVMQ